VLRPAPLLAAALLLSACQTTQPVDGDAVQIEPVRAGELLPRSVEGRPIDVWTVGEGERVVLFLAAIHGNEQAGPLLIERLREVLEAEPERAQGLRVVIVPVVNPDGLGSDLRHNANDVDLNRNFPASNREEGAAFGERALSEPEALFLAGLIEGERPACIVTVHQPLGCIDWDGPAEELARQLGALGVLPVHRLGSRTGSLGSWAGEDLGIPVITLELPSGMDRKSGDYLWERFGPLLLAVLSSQSQS
jgi:protein MpaA